MILEWSEYSFMVRNTKNAYWGSLCLPELCERLLWSLQNYFKMLLQVEIDWIIKKARKKTHFEEIYVILCMWYTPRHQGHHLPQLWTMEEIGTVSWALPVYISFVYGQVDNLLLPQIVTHPPIDGWLIPFLPIPRRTKEEGIVEGGSSMTESLNHSRVTVLWGGGSHSTVSYVIV